MGNSIVLDPKSKREEERALRQYILAWVNVTDDGHWFWLGAYRPGRPLLRTFRGVKYEVHYKLCTGPDGPWPCIALGCVDGSGGFADKIKG